MPSETISALWGGENIVPTRCDCTCQFARHICLHISPFQLVFEPSKCPSASTAGDKRSVKEEEETEEFEEEGSKEDGENAPAAKRRKVPKSQSNVLLSHEDKLPL